jgi:hypothetical protein
MIDEAIESYEMALAAEMASASVRAVEQLANLRARRAARQKAPQAETIINGAIALLENLPKLSDGGHTSERLSLLGSCYKRLAQVTVGDARAAALGKMRERYKDAFERKQQRSDFDPYPLLNWLLAETLLTVFSDYQAPERVDEWLDRAEAEALALEAKDPSFWSGITAADVALGRALWHRGVDAVVQGEIVEAYLKPWRRGASRLEFASVFEQLAFVRTVLEGENADPVRRELCSALGAIEAQLHSQTGLA